jgi:hypothetical protein
MYVMVNGEKKLTDEYAITLKADLKEDFSKMTVEERQQAPIVEYAATTNLGTIKTGKKIASKITLSNVGLNPLVIRRVISNDKDINAYAPKSAIKGGKKADLKFDLNTANMAAGTYARVITLITNDPAHSVIRLRVEWVVE